MKKILLFLRQYSFPGFFDGLLLLVVLKLFFAGSPEIFFGDSGAGWHLLSGKLISETWLIPRSDPFLAAFVTPFISTNWVHSQWLSDFFYWNILSFSSWDGLRVFCYFILLLPFAVILGPELQRRARNSLAIALSLLLCLSAQSIQWLFRPVLFSFLLYALVLRITISLSRDSEKPFKRYLLLLFVFLFWANLHPAWVLGFLPLSTLLFFQLFDFIFNRNSSKKIHEIFKFVACLFAAFLLTFVNPVSWRLHASVLSLAKSTYFMGLNREWLAPRITEFAFWPFFAVILLFSSYLLWQRQRVCSEGGIRRFELLSLLVLGSVACFQRRYIPFFALTALAPLASVLSVFLSRYTLFHREPLERGALSRFGLTSLCLSILFVFSAFVSVGAKDSANLQRENPANKLYPRTLVDFILAEEGAAARVLHSPDLGGFITFQSGGERGFASIDDRNVLNGEARYRSYLSLLGIGEKKEELLAFDWILLLKKRPLSLFLEKNDSWLLLKEEATELGLFQLYRSKALRENDKSRSE